MASDSVKKEVKKNSDHYVRSAMMKCGCTSEIEFFKRASSAGSPPRDSVVADEVQDFLDHKKVPKYVDAFAKLVHAGRCPKKCYKTCPSRLRVLVA